MRIESDILKTTAVVLLLCGAYGGVVFWPSQKQNKALAAAVHDKRGQLETIHIPDLNPLGEEIAELRAELRESRIELPKGASPYRVLDGLSEAITSNGVTVYDTAQHPTQHFARFAVTPVEVQFNCGFDQAFDVLQTIENAGQPLRIERLELIGSADEATGHVGVNIRMSSFFLPQKQEGGER